MAVAVIPVAEHLAGAPAVFTAVERLAGAPAAIAAVGTEGPNLLAKRRMMTLTGPPFT